jgi:hypothetical protein
MLIGRRREADREGVEVVEHLPPEPEDRPGDPQMSWEYAEFQSSTPSLT